jgi:putative oxidoreductase
VVLCFPWPLDAETIEPIAGPLIAIGLIAALAAFIASGEMAVAYFTAHVSRGFVPLVSHGELAVFYCFAFIPIAPKGPDRWSLNVLLTNRPEGR